MEPRLPREARTLSRESDQLLLRALLKSHGTACTKRLMGLLKAELKVTSDLDKSSCRGILRLLHSLKWDVHSQRSKK